VSRVVNLSTLSLGIDWCFPSVFHYSQDPLSLLYARSYPFSAFVFPRSSFFFFLPSFSLPFYLLDFLSELLNHRMETPYPSQLALAASNSSTGAANSNSSNSRLSSGTSSSSTSTIDELRSTRHCNSGEPGEGSSEGGASQREAEYENGMEQGSSARPRTMLRRSRTTNQVERRREVAQRERRASAIALSLREEQDWVNLQQFSTEEGVRKGGGRGDSRRGMVNTRTHWTRDHFAFESKLRRNSSTKSDSFSHDFCPRPHPPSSSYSCTCSITTSL